jgi:cation:H+ antiporter
MLTWLQFFITALAIIICGSKLSHYGDIIAEKTRLGRVFIGVIFLAFITSLPELSTTISTAAWIQQPDLTLGDIFGSNAFNLVIIGILDLLEGRGALTNTLCLPRTHLVTSKFVLLLTAIALSGLLTKSLVRVSNIGVESIIIGIVYLIGLKIISKQEVAELGEREPRKEIKALPRLWNVTLKFILSGIVVIIGGIYLAQAGEEIVKATGLTRTFVGVVFLALVTSFPELIVSIAALRLGRVEMAIGNILGSNMFNLMIISIGDICYQKGPLLANVSSDQLIMGALSGVLAIIIALGILCKRKRSFLFLGLDTFSVLALYFIGLYFLFKRGS